MRQDVKWEPRTKGLYTSEVDAPVSSISEYAATCILALCSEGRVGSGGGAVDVGEGFAVADCGLVSSTGVGLRGSQCGEQTAE